jgi:hypothetical protein
VTAKRKDEFEEKVNLVNDWAAAVAMVSTAVSRERARLMDLGDENNPEYYAKSAALGRAWERILRG